MSFPKEQDGENADTKAAPEAKLNKPLKDDISAYNLIINQHDQRAVQNLSTSVNRQRHYEQIDRPFRGIFFRISSNVANCMD
jgi:hypothetical protein